MSSKARSSSQRFNNGDAAREDTPLLGNSRANSQTPLSSKAKTFANFFNAIVGAGVLGLPYVFKRTGWLMGLIMLFSVASLMYYCMLLLVYTRRKLESHVDISCVNSFGDLGFIICGEAGRFVVDLMIFLSHVGFCIGYMIFIANTLYNIFNSDLDTLNLTSTEIFGFSVRSLSIWGCFPFQLGLNSITTLTHLAPLSIFAGVVDLAAMGVVMVEDVLIFSSERIHVEAFGSLSSLLYGIGVVVYMFEGVGMVLPIDSEAKNKESFGTILALTMAFITITYGGFSVLGYFAFGMHTKDIITSNLGKGFISTVVQLGLAINLFLTFPLMMNPVYEILERRLSSGRYCLWVRWLMVLVVCLVALYVPNFTDFLSLVGSSVCCGLAFMLPSLFHLLAHKDVIGWREWIVDGSIFAIGIVLLVSGTWSSLESIISHDQM